VPSIKAPTRCRSSGCHLRPIPRHRQLAVVVLVSGECSEGLASSHP
jgi:hypothetical protein